MEEVEGVVIGPEVTERAHTHARASLVRDLDELFVALVDVHLHLLALVGERRLDADLPVHQRVVGLEEPCVILEPLLTRVRLEDEVLCLQGPSVSPL